jgi:acyl-CoA thioesterase
MPNLGSARDAFARKVICSLHKRDETARSLGIIIEAAGMGWCKIKMLVRDDMVNGHALAHGGFIFTLADIAMAYASNGENNQTLAQHCQITFISPGRRGEELTASASEISKTGRNGLYDIQITGQDGRLVAAFRGATRTVKGQTDPLLGEAPKS